MTLLSAFVFQHVSLLCLITCPTVLDRALHVRISLNGEEVFRGITGDDGSGDASEVWKQLPRVRLKATHAHHMPHLDLDNGALLPVWALDGCVSIEVTHAGKMETDRISVVPLISETGEVSWRMDPECVNSVLSKLQLRQPPQSKNSTSEPQFGVREVSVIQGRNQELFVVIVEGLLFTVSHQKQFMPLQLSVWSFTSGETRLRFSCPISISQRVPACFLPVMDEDRLRILECYGPIVRDGNPRLRHLDPLLGLVDGQSLPQSIREIGSTVNHRISENWGLGDISDSAELLCEKASSDRVSVLSLHPRSVEDAMPLTFELGVGGRDVRLEIRKERTRANIVVRTNSR